MARWPNVPDCYGWLGLDARGHWYLRDSAVQACGAFASGLPGARGERLQHEKLVEFIGRNYEADDAGRWYFQNGPQRVFVELEVAPWIWRVQQDGSVRAHTGVPARVRQVWLDERGRVYLQTDLGFGLVHTQDTGIVADWLQSGRWSPETLAAAELPRRFGYVTSPRPA